MRSGGAGASDAPSEVCFSSVTWPRPYPTSNLGKGEFAASTTRVVGRGRALHWRTRRFSVQPGPDWTTPHLREEPDGGSPASPRAGSRSIHADDGVAALRARGPHAVTATVVRAGRSACSSGCRAVREGPTTGRAGMVSARGPCQVRNGDAGPAGADHERDRRLQLRPIVVDQAHSRPSPRTWADASAQGNKLAL